MKKRYLLIRGKKEGIEKAILDYLGILGYAKASPIFVRENEKGIVLAVDRSQINDIRAAFELAKDIKVLKVSGTLDSLGK